MSKEVPAAELGWFPECNSCGHRTLGGLIFFSPCSLVKFSKEGGEESFVMKPEAFIGDNGEFNCKEFLEVEKKPEFLVFLDESHESEMVRKLLEVVGANYTILSYSNQGIDVTDDMGFGYHSLPMVKYRLVSDIDEFIKERNLDWDSFDLDGFLEGEIAKDKAEIEKRKNGDGYVRVTMDEVRAFQEKQKIT